MPTQPDVTVHWSTDTNDTLSNLLKVEPPESVKDTGLLNGSPFARVWHNFYFNYFTEGLGWLFEERYKIGAVVSFINGTEPSFAEWRGTWSSIGTQAIGGDTVIYFERTA